MAPGDFDDHDDDDADEPWYIDVAGDAWRYHVAGETRVLLSESFMAEEPGEECGDEVVTTVPLSAVLHHGSNEEEDEEPCE